MKINRYIEIYDNDTEDIIFRIKLNLSIDNIKKIIACDDDENLVFAYEINSQQLEKFGIKNFDTLDKYSFFLSSASTSSHIETLKFI